MTGMRGRRRSLAAGLAAALLLPATALAGQSPRVNYMLNCQGCHLPDGRGMSGKVPDLRGELPRFLEVPGGREFVVQVPGTANSKLSDADTADLLNWLIKEMGASDAAPFQHYTEAEVRRLRMQRLQNVAPVRAGLVEQIRNLRKPAPPASSTPTPR